MNATHVFDELFMIFERHGAVPLEAVALWGEYCTLCTHAFHTSASLAEVRKRIRVYAATVQRSMTALLQWIEAGHPAEEWPGPLSVEMARVSAAAFKTEDDRKSNSQPSPVQLGDALHPLPRFVPAGVGGEHATYDGEPVYPTGSKCRVCADPKYRFPDGSESCVHFC